MSRLSGMSLLEQINLISTDPMYALGFPEAATLTGITKNIVPESPLHPHSDHLVAEQEKKAKKRKERRDDLELEETRNRMHQLAYPQDMRRGGRVKLIDGCAVSGKTRGRTV